jgi:hypothetical protein
MAGDDHAGPFGLDALPGLLERVGAKRLFVVTGPSARHLDTVRSLFGERSVYFFPGERRLVPESVIV